MTGIKLDCEPAEVGIDRAQLVRLDAHFRRYVDDGKLPGFQVTVARHGRLVHASRYGRRDIEADLPVTDDTLWRIYSMSKPVTSVAAMILHEEGAFELNDPVSGFIPSFSGSRVFAGGSDVRPVTVPATEPVRIWHLLTHTSGLTYGFHRAHPVDARYRAAGFEWSVPRGMDLAGCCEAWAEQPLLFQPGTEWNYSVATDVLGRVVEVASGQRLGDFLAERIFAPLGMTDTGFWVGEADRERLAALYTAGPESRATRLDALARVASHPPSFEGGGGGLISTAADYHRFTSMLASWPGKPAGELDGARILGSRTVGYMGRNHLPGDADLHSFGRPLFAETPFLGVGFGLGFAVLLDPVPSRVPGSVGELAWGGAASTAFFVDRAEGLVVQFFTQLLPSSAYPIRSQLRQLIYPALLD